MSRPSSPSLRSGSNHRTTPVTTTPPAPASFEHPARSDVDVPSGAVTLPPAPSSPSGPSAGAGIRYRRAVAASTRRQPPQIPASGRMVAAYEVHAARTGQPRHTRTASPSHGVLVSVVNTSRSTGSTPGHAHPADRPHSPGGATTREDAAAGAPAVEVVRGMPAGSRRAGAQAGRHPDTDPHPGGHGPGLAEPRSAASAGGDPLLKDFTGGARRLGVLDVGAVGCAHRSAGGGEQQRGGWDQEQPAVGGRAESGVVATGRATRDREGSGGRLSAMTPPAPDGGAGGGVHSGGAQVTGGVLAGWR